MTIFISIVIIIAWAIGVLTHILFLIKKRGLIMTEEDRQELIDELEGEEQQARDEIEAELRASEPPEKSINRVVKHPSGWCCADQNGNRVSEVYRKKSEAFSALLFINELEADDDELEELDLV